MLENRSFAGDSDYRVLLGALALSERKGSVSRAEPVQLQGCDAQRSASQDRGVSAPSPGLGSELGSESAPGWEAGKRDCAHERITLLSPVGPFVCTACGSVVDRRFAHPAATLETGSGTPDTTEAR